MPAKLPTPGRDRQGAEGQGGLPPAGEGGLHEERGEDGEEAAEAAQCRVGAQGEDDVRAHPTPASAGHRDLRGGEDVGLQLAGRHVDVPRQPEGEHPGRRGRRRRSRRAPRGTRARRDPGPEAARDPCGGQPEDRQAGVGRRQRHGRRQHPRDDRGAQHVVRLRQHQDAERRRVEPEVVEVAQHHQRQDGPADMAAGHRPPAAALQPVQRGADDRRHDGERRHRDQQVQRHVAALGVGRRGEEEGAGQGDGDHRVAGHVQGVDPQQLGQAALAGAVGPAGRAHPVRGGGGELPGTGHRHAGDGDLRPRAAGGSSGTTSVGCSSGECQPAAPVGPPGCGTPSGVVSTRSGLLGPECPPTARAGAHRAVGGRRARVHGAARACAGGARPPGRGRPARSGTMAR